MNMTDWIVVSSASMLGWLLMMALVLTVTIVVSGIRSSSPSSVRRWGRRSPVVGPVLPCLDYRPGWP